MFILYVLDSWELLEHGTTVRCSWLSPEGKALLHLLDRCKDLNFEKETGFSEGNWL